MDALGRIAWWGFTPAVDLQQWTEACSSELNILMVGAGDLRHILTTVAQSYRHMERKLNFFVLESSLELYARHMLFLKLALESQDTVGLQDKTEIFLELYGNSLVRQQCMDYVETAATDFIKMITDYDYLQTALPLLDLSNLKFKERDFLEGIFKLWRNTTKAVFDIEKCWDLRLRQHLGVRYDAIPNVFDWDFHMKLTDKNAGIIGSRNYSKWRKTGIAFEIRDGTYDIANRTLASGMVFKHEGESYPRRGYWGDIVVSPYIAFGIESENNEFFRKRNDVYVQTSQDVSEYNITSLLHEIAHRCPYVAPQSDDQSSGNTSSHSSQVNNTSSSSDIQQFTTDATQPTVPSVNSFTRIFFLPLNSTTELYKKSKFSKLFDIVYFANSVTHLLTPDLSTTFNDSSVVIVETAKFLLEIHPEQQEEFVRKVTELAAAAGCKAAHTTDTVKDAHMKFTFTR